jgi:hypothetical protein
VLQPAGIAASPDERLLAMSTLLFQSRVDDLRSSFTGEVLTDLDAGYDEARRVHNAMIDRRPALAVSSGAAPG